MLRILLLLLIVLASLRSEAQFRETFSDADFTQNPVWQGDTSAWVVNANGELQSNHTTANARFYLSTASTLAREAEWQWTSRLLFNPSSANYVDVHLLSTAPDPGHDSSNGYFVRIGQTDDDICLYRKDGSGIVKIIDGTNGLLNGSSHEIRVSVSRGPNHLWTLRRSHNRGAWRDEGSTTDSTYTVSAYFGISVQQSTASFFQKHFFDDISVQSWVRDSIAPTIREVIVPSPMALSIRFSESIDSVSSSVPARYRVTNGVGYPITARPDSTDPSVVHLQFADTLPARTALTLHTLQISDLQGNVMDADSASFTRYIPRRFDVLITEIMPDPSPAVGLPETEWLEIRNVSPFVIPLSSWRLGKTGAFSGTLPALNLAPDSALVLCSVSSAPGLSAFAATAGLSSFPSLSNEGDLISLHAADGQTIHALAYNKSWYRNELKAEGGWSLEMIDTQNPCGGAENFMASVDPLGATPGKSNSVKAVQVDDRAPRLLRAYVTDSISLHLVFTESIDSLSALSSNQYQINPAGLQVIQVIPSGPLFRDIKLILSSPLQPQTIYDITVQGLTDCAGNLLESPAKARFTLPEMADSMDIVVNEILFNPRGQAVDYVEIANRGRKATDLQKMYIGNRNSAGQISSLSRISESPYLFFPGELVVISASGKSVQEAYQVRNPDALIDISAMPSLPDDEGYMLLVNDRGQIVDELHYYDDWHHPLISDPEAVALERIRMDAPTQNKENWASAPASVGYGTPTWKNAQQAVDSVITGEWVITPPVFSPDGDGFDDFAFIHYRLPEPGFICNLYIYDMAGRLVRHLQRNTLCGREGYFRWDGLNDKQGPIPGGPYVLFIELFNLQAKKKQLKRTVVLARNKR